MPREPVEDARVHVHAVLGRAVDQEDVAAARVAGQLDLAADLLEAHEHLLGLADWAALIRLALDDEGRRLAAVDVGSWRAASELLGRVPRRAAAPLVGAGVGDVG